MCDDRELKASQAISKPLMDIDIREMEDFETTDEFEQRRNAHFL